MRTSGLVIQVPPGALVLPIGASGSGKSTFAARHFDAEAIVSSDRLRGTLTGDEGDQRATTLAFDRLHQWVDARLATGAPAVVDATNIDWMWRSRLIEVARRHARPAIAIVFALPVEVCLARNGARPRSVPRPVVRRQVDVVTRDLDRLDLEGFVAVYVLRSVSDVDAARLEIEKGPVARALH
jgi:protein phosphatase